MKYSIKRALAFVITLAMLGGCITAPASAQGAVTVLSERCSGENLISGITVLNKYDNTSGSETEVPVSKKLEYGVGGKLTEDDSAHIVLDGMNAGEDFAKCDSHKQFYGYMVSNYTKTGYVVMEANVLPAHLNLGYFTLLTSNNRGLSQNKQPSDIGIKAGQWNNIRMVVNMNTASLDSAPYRYPDVTAYINGVAYDMSKGESSSAIASYNPGRLIFSGEADYVYTHDLYWDDCITYLSEEDPGAPAMPSLEAGSGFSVSGSDIILEGKVTISGLRTQPGYTIRVYDDSSLGAVLDSRVNLSAGNVIVVADDTEKLYTTYYVKENIIAYANGNDVSGGFTLDTARFSSTFTDGFAGKAKGDISRYKDAGEGSVHDAVFYQTSGYTMSAKTAKYLVAEMSIYPDMSAEQTNPFLYMSMKSLSHIDVTPQLRLISDTAGVPCILPNKWNKVVYVIENRHIADGTDFSSTAVSDSVAKAGKHRLTVFVNGKEVVTDYTMPYWGMKWSKGTSNFLRIGHCSTKDSQNDSHTAYDNVKLYEMSSFDKSSFALAPSLAENGDVHYGVDGATLRIYNEFAVKVSDLKTVSHASVRAYTDATFTNELASGVNLADGNVVAVADESAVTYYNVVSQTSASAVLAQADTSSQWSLIANGGVVVENVPGKPLSDGAYRISADTSAVINCTSGYEENEYLVSEFNIYADSDASISIGAGDASFGTVSLSGGKWTRLSLIIKPQGNSAELYANGAMVRTSADVDFTCSSLILTPSGSDVYADNLISYSTPLYGTVKYAPGEIYENDNIILNGDKVKIKAGTTTVSALPSKGEAVVYRKGTIAGGSEYISSGDIVFVDNDDHIGTYFVDGFTVDYEFENSDAGCAKGTIGIDLPEKYDYTLVDLFWAYTADGAVTPLEDYLPIKSFTGADLRRGYTITKDMFIPQAADSLLARYYHGGAEIDFIFEIPQSKRMTDTEPEVIIALSSDYHFDTSVTSKHIMTRKHIDSYADAVVVNGDIINWWGSHSKAQIDAYQSNKGAIGGEWENELSQFDYATEFFKGFNIPVYMVQGNHDVPETGRYNINATYGATTSWRYSDYLNNWIDYSMENGYYEDAIEREVDKTYTGPADKSNLATFYDDYVKGYHLIFLRVPYESGGKAYYDLMKQELDFLDRKLYELEESGKPVFVFSHVPIEDTIGRAQETWENSQVRQQAFKDILNKHPNAIVVSGHSHFGLDNDWEWTVNGHQEKPAFVHDGGIVSQITPIDNDRSNDITDYSESSCVYAEVYGDRVVTRGYDLINEKWIPQGINQITRKPKSTVGDISVSKVERDGLVFLKAESDSDTTLEWTADGITFDGDVLALPDSYDGFVAVRATDSKGDYRSISFKNTENIAQGDFDIIDYDEGRSDYVSAKSTSDDYILNNGQENGITTYETAIGGKGIDDESARLYIASGGRTWGAPVPSRGGASKRYWKQADPDSKYLVFSMNVMPASDDTVYALVGTNGGAPLTAKSTDNLNKYQWNKIVGVYNIETSTIDTYINGKLVSGGIVTGFKSGYDIRITFEGKTYYSTDTFELTGYADDVDIYETKNLPLLLFAQELGDGSYGDVTVDNASVCVYVPAGMTVSGLNKSLGVAVSDKYGKTKLDGNVSEGDYAVYYDSAAKAYRYYDIKTLYTADFTKGVENGVINEADVAVNVVATGTERAVVAQYGTDGSLVKAEIFDMKNMGENTIEFSKGANADEVKIMIIGESFKPLAKAIELEA